MCHVRAYQTEPVCFYNCQKRLDNCREKEKMQTRFCPPYPSVLSSSPSARGVTNVCLSLYVERAQMGVFGTSQGSVKLVVEGSVSVNFLSVPGRPPVCAFTGCAVVLALPYVCLPACFDCGQ